MRTPCIVLSAILSILAKSVFAGDATVANTPYPASVAVSQTGEGQWVYKSFPFFLPLYVFDGEPAGKSSCDQVCTAVWPIIRAEEGDKPIGLWTIIKRDDNRLQWAFKNRAVYTYFEDIAGEPRGAGKDKNWYLDDAAQTYLRKAGVRLPAPITRNMTTHENGGAKIFAVLLKP